MAGETKIDARPQSLTLSPAEARGVADGTITVLWRPMAVQPAPTWTYNSKPEDHPDYDDGWHEGVLLGTMMFGGKLYWQYGAHYGSSPNGLVVCPWKPGEIVYVAEAWMGFDPSFMTPATYKVCQDDKARSRFIVYRAECDYHCDWDTPESMPAWAARTWLRLTPSVQRVCDITEADAVASGFEGVNVRWSSPYFIGPHTDDGELPSEEFRRECTAQHGADAWKHWAWRLEVERVERPQ